MPFSTEWAERSRFSLLRRKNVVLAESASGSLNSLSASSSHGRCHPNVVLMAGSRCFLPCGWKVYLYDNGASEA